MNTYSAEYFANPMRVRYSITEVLRAHIVRLPAAGKVLDLGCGDMQLLFEIAKMRPDLILHGVDIGDVRIPAGTIRFTRSDATAFVPDDAYQLVLAVDVLEHLQRPEQLVTVARKALAVGGEFYTSVPCTTKLLLFGDENFFSDYSHVRPFSCKSMTRLLNDQGLRVTSSAALGHGQRSIVRMVYYLTRGVLTLNTNYLNAAIKMLGGTTIETVAERCEQG